MKFHLTGDLEPAELAELVAFLRELDGGRTDRVHRIWMEDESLTQEQAQAFLHQMGFHNQVVLPNDPQGIHFDDKDGA